MSFSGKENEEAIQILMKPSKGSFLSEEKSEIIKSLVKIGKPAVMPLIKALSDYKEKNAVICRALTDLAGAECIDNMDPLIPFFQDKDMQAKTSMIIGDITDGAVLKDHYNLFLENLNSEDWIVRSMCIKSLGRIGIRDAVGPLEELLSKEEDRLVCLNIKDAISKLKSSS